MRWCKFCGEQIQWFRDGKKIIPLDCKGRDHRKFCIRSEEYIKKREEKLNKKFKV